MERFLLPFTDRLKTIYFEHCRYVATMGPTHPNSFTQKLPIDYEDGEAVDTCPDFWKLCWDTNATIIVMLCSISPGFRGCSLYFPEGSYLKFLKLRISAN